MDDNKDNGDRPLVVMATATWCGPCRYFKENVLPTVEVQAAMADVRFVTLDADNYRARLQSLGVSAYPTFLVVTPQGRVVAQVRGAVSASKFVDFLKWGTPAWFSEDSLRAQLKNAPGRRIHVYAARFHAMSGNLPEARVQYERALASLGPDEAAQAATVAWEIALVGSVGQRVGLAARQAMKFVATYPEAAEVRSATEFVLLSGALRDVERKALADKALSLFWDRPTTLNDLVYTLLAARLPTRALRAAVQQIALRPDDANAYDTLGEAHSALGQTEQALHAADTALRMETASDSRSTYKANRARFASGSPSKTIAARRQQFEKLLRRYRRLMVVLRHCKTASARQLSPLQPMN